MDKKKLLTAVLREGTAITLEANCDSVPRYAAFHTSYLQMTSFLMEDLDLSWMDIIKNFDK